MKEFFKKHWILGLIIVLAALLRLWGLSYNPPHLTSDEAALGYNAYSILKTGRDEHGQVLPIIFQSFGDWKPGLYVYLTVPSVAIFGLNEFAVRLPGAVMGILAVFLIGLLANYLFPNRKLGNWAAFLLAISPWHLQFSRGAWEAGVSLTLVLLGIYFFLRAVKDRPKWIFLSVIFFALTLWTYQGAKLSTSVVIVGLLLFFRNEFRKLPRNLIIKATLLGIIIIMPIILSIAQGKTGRLEVYSIFSYRRSEETINDIISREDIGKNSLQYILFHSEKLNFLRGILGRWSSHYSGQFLFFEGDWKNTRHGVPDAGVILLVDSLLLISGLIVLVRIVRNKNTLFIWYWLLLAPLPAALSRDAIHAVRTLNMVIPLTIILALGLQVLWEKKTKLGKLAIPAVLIFCFAYLANYVYYLDQYWVHAPKRNSQYWQYGYKQMVKKVSSLQSKYPEIVISQDYSQPYIFFLFYQKYDPTKYQKISNDVYIPNKYGDVGLISKLDNIIFRDINWSADRGMTGKLFVVDPIEVPIVDSIDQKEFNLIDEITFLNGEDAFRFLEIR